MAEDRRCFIKLAVRPRFGDMAVEVYGSGLSDVAPAIDHKADCHFGDRSDEAWRRVGDENPLGASGGKSMLRISTATRRNATKSFSGKSQPSRGLPVEMMISTP